MLNGHAVNAIQRSQRPWALWENKKTPYMVKNHSFILLYSSSCAAAFSAAACA